MKVLVKKSGEVIDVEYDDDDLYMGYSKEAGRVIYLYYNEFIELEDEVIKKLGLENQ